MLCILLAATLAAAAQGSVKGTVIDRQTNEVLQFVNVKVNEASTGKMVKGSITDVNGKFNITGLPNGSYELEISYIGYKNATRNFTISAGEPQQSFARIYLGEDNQVLQEVEVTGQRSQMKLEVDRKTFSVDQMLAASGGSASDLLENIPSVEIDTDGEISLRGNTSVEVWINGKASGLTSDNRAEILQQIPAESIERVEVIDNPSAKYSPEGSAGIINIVLKRDRKGGYYGSLRGGADTRGGWNTSGNINYSSGTLEAFANIGYRNRKNSGGTKSEQTYTSSQQYQNYETENENNGSNIFARAGVTWLPTTKDELSLSGMTMLGNRDNLSLTPYHYGSIGAQEDSYVMYRRNTSKGDMTMFHVEMDYTHNFGEKHKIDFNLSFDRWINDQDNYYQDSTTWTGGAQPTEYSYQYRPLQTNNRSWEAKIDYENQITEDLKLEAGYDGRFSHENSPQESWIDDTGWDGLNTIEDEEYFNRFIYDLDVHALYATVTTAFGPVGVMAGLRGEYWKVRTESYDYSQEHDASLRDTPFNKDYFQLFPSLFLSYHFDETAQMQLNYTRRLRRPWGGQLNSFRDTRDASMISFGNPELTPEYTNSFSLNFLKQWRDHTLSVSAYYRPTTDVIQRVTYNRNDTIYSTNQNVSKSQSMGVELIAKNKLFRILDLTTTVNAYYYKLDAFSYTIDDQVVTGDADENFSWDARMLASFILPYDISFQATGRYTSRRVITQGYRKPNASLDMGLRKTFLNKTLALSINWRDVLGTRRWKNYTSSESFERYQENWRDPKVNITLTWNFGNMGSDKKRNRQSEYNDDSDSTEFNEYN